MVRNVWVIVAVAAVVVAVFGGVAAYWEITSAAAGGELVIFHAGSLSVPFGEVSAEFEKMYPDITIKAEAAGSRMCARKISELGRACDVMGSADYKVVGNLLMGEHVDFNIRFALNEMAIAYTDGSRCSVDITAENWYDILAGDDVAFGRSDPDMDPCGYRTLMVFQLAEKHYEIPGLAARLRAKDRHIRPKETDLLALLEAGEIDYLFIYRSVAVQHGLKTVLLPDEINLKSQAHAALYNTAVVEVSGRRPGEPITRRGEPMVYSVTIPMNAPNRRAAEAWVALLLSEKGREIMETNGQRCMRPAEVDGADRLPDSLKEFFE
ncbi:MAG: tungstate ABC transporter substrate-binding protein WtpA [Planctomycetota bacterium]|nr:MAG: tungstate ABC transporter substrate-binding protein WtpA [Planctomycetota bacterium]